MPIFPAAVLMIAFIWTGCLSLFFAPSSGRSRCHLAVFFGSSGLGGGFLGARSLDYFFHDHLALVVELGEELIDREADDF